METSKPSTLEGVRRAPHHRRLQSTSAQEPSSNHPSQEQRSRLAHLAELSPEQRAVVLERAQRILVVAGAGSGKTRVLISCMFQILQEGVSSDAIIAFSFTRKSCEEIKERLHSRFQEMGMAPPRRRLAFTFHGFAHQLVRRHYRELGLSTPPEILTDNEGGELLDVFTRFLKANASEGSSESPHDLFFRMRPGAGRLKSPESAVLEREFTKWKRTEGIAEFSDLIPMALELLSGPVGEMIRERVKVVLVDEFQDIDANQQQLFRLLLRPTTRFLLFGDDDQAIYRWRGSKPELIRGYFRDPEVTIHELSTNYRCRHPILNLAQKIVQGDSERIPKVARAHHKTGLAPKFVSARDQAKAVARVVADLRKRGRPLDQMAILVRDHADAREVRHGLARAGIPAGDPTAEVSVKLLTYHASKGLEFSIVLMPFMDRGRFPNTRRLRKEATALKTRMKTAVRALRSQSRLEEALQRLRRKASSENAVFHFGLRHFIRWIRIRLQRPEGGLFRKADRESQILELEARIRCLQTTTSWLPALQSALRGLAKEQQEVLAEERRLCYVAMTRAKEELWLFGKKKSDRSEFLAGLRRGDLVYHSLPEAKG